MTTLKQIRNQLSDACRQTALCGSETYYPASWRFGAGVGDASTAARGDCGLEIAAEHVAASLGVHLDRYVFTGCYRQRDCADIIAAALREQAARDADVDAHADDELPTPRTRIGTCGCPNARGAGSEPKSAALTEP